jgi:hypothetical protein
VRTSKSPVRDEMSVEKKRNHDDGKNPVLFSPSLGNESENKTINYNDALRKWHVFRRI